ncbi:MAG: hypothetical protein ACR2N2_00990 [Acidimicrobiia bacterium]
MTTIRTTCESCGDVELTTTDISLELAGNGDEGTYRFVCPSCTSTQRRPASQRVVSILLATGVAYEVTVGQPPITEAEIGQFVSELESDDWFGRLVASDS